MSTYWGYRCETCAINTHEWFNHGEEKLRTIYENRHVLATALSIIEPIGEAYFHGVYDSPGPVEFLTEHDGHAIVLHNEYGRTAGLGEQTPCSDVSTEGAAWAMEGTG